MTVEELKDNIDKRTLNNDLLIFIGESSNFLIYQYLREIKKLKDVDYVYIDDLPISSYNSVDLFDQNSSENLLRIYYCNEFNIIDNNIKYDKNLIIITSKIDSEVKKFYTGNVVEFPKLEDWHIKDYVYSLAEGVETSELDWFINLCQNDIYRIDNEINKLNIFPSNHRKFLFKELKENGGFGNLSIYNIFNITNAIQSHDIETLNSILPEISSIDVEPTGLVTLLYQNFKKLINVWLTPNPTPDNTGLKSNQIWAIKNLPHNFSKDDLIRIFKLLAEMDENIKTGKIPVNLVVDYLLIKILG